MIGCVMHSISQFCPYLVEEAFLSFLVPSPAHFRVMGTINPIDHLSFQSILTRTDSPP
ncbi:hypothetical protein NEOLEDRAFT_86348 [Neolentinus lepideus HHB14362 ss-1]|uniref:Uncharacterized protein n=1 Tax=Neolentinus lepideus HHB14362 ss-1 TaxID=1314782 RepID=A0A165MXF7_9AGAM|nr:hypothetical protein NEOLEDRAFT_86348 [Neolentinus lepideus HHB14362 ss-1]